MPDHTSAASRTYRALVVHPQPNSAERLLRILNDLGCTAEIVGNPLEAVRRFNGARFDLIVMDPSVESASHEAAELLYSRLAAPVLYVCADSKPIGFQALARGIGFLVPPLDPVYMQALIKRALRGPGMMA